MRRALLWLLAALVIAVASVAFGVGTVELVDRFGR